jgi:16S rRNA (cytosine967-C5)-methyltransferase
MQRQLGEEFWPWVESIGRPAPLDLRVNVAKASREQALARLREAGIAAARRRIRRSGSASRASPRCTSSTSTPTAGSRSRTKGSQLLR